MTNENEVEKPKEKKIHWKMRQRLEREAHETDESSLPKKKVGRPRKVKISESDVVPIKNNTIHLEQIVNSLSSLDLLLINSYNLVLTSAVSFGKGSQAQVLLDIAKHLFDMTRSMTMMSVCFKELNKNEHTKS